MVYVPLMAYCDDLVRDVILGWYDDVFAGIYLQWCGSAVVGVFRVDVVSFLCCRYVFAPRPFFAQDGWHEVCAVYVHVFVGYGCCVVHVQWFDYRKLRLCHFDVFLCLRLRWCSRSLFVCPCCCYRGASLS